MNYSEEAQELAYAWEMTGTPLEAIAEMVLFLNSLLESYREKED